MEKKENLSRRELLKALTTAGGAVAAAAFLPNKWSKPVVDVGALPAHAQSTGVTISNLNLFFQINNNDVQEVPPLSGSIDYYDPLGEVDAPNLLTGGESGTLFFGAVEPCGQVPFNYVVVGSCASNTYYGKNSTNYNGQIRFNFLPNASCFYNETPYFYTHMKVNGRMSNSLSKDLPYDEPT